MEIYAFEYTECVYESSLKPISLHKTKKGAYEAMKKFVSQEYEYYRSSSVKLGQFEKWRIKTYKLLD